MRLEGAPPFQPGAGSIGPHRVLLFEAAWEAGPTAYLVAPRPERVIWRDRTIESRRPPRRGGVIRSGKYRAELALRRGLPDHPRLPRRGRRDRAARGTP